MSNKAQKSLDKLITITTRVFEDDVKKLKERAAREYVPWQVLLRLTIRRALAKEATIK